MAGKHGLRRHDRVRQSAPVQVSWRDGSGNEKFANAEILDVSEAGIRVKVPESFADRTLVTLRSDRLELHGQASARSCVRQGAKYLLGLEFVGGLKWTPPSGEIATGLVDRRQGLRCDVEPGVGNGANLTEEDHEAP
jgi:hypothetical protein